MSAPERVPLWYHKGYSLGHVSSELRKGGYTEDEAAQRVVAYADWLRRQELAAASAQPRPPR